MSWDEMVRQEKAEKLLAEALEATPMETASGAQGYVNGDVLLTCGHLLHFDVAPPHKKEVVWCPRCHSERNVQDRFTGRAFRVKCETCSFNRSRQGEIQADRAAIAHRIKRGFLHTVVILGANNSPIRKFEGKTEENMLPNEPPY